MVVNLCQLNLFHLWLLYIYILYTWFWPQILSETPGARVMAGAQEQFVTEIGNPTGTPGCLCRFKMSMGYPLAKHSKLETQWPSRNT